MNTNAPVPQDKIAKLMRMQRQYRRLLTMLPRSGTDMELVAEEMAAVTDDMRRILEEAIQWITTLPR